MKLNIELAERILEQITEHPETHDQSHWGEVRECGTVCCIAGWAILLSDDHRVRFSEGGVRSPALEILVGENYWTGYDDDVSRRAAHLLGLDNYSSLFYEGDENYAREKLAWLIERAKKDKEEA
ncbi:hypothetical protein BJD55_gp131 [Gordonia phage Yvonnetastic]|uniref:Uncharacterized protein n=1 Tax=Gordonia phage Yvonnetastic TaxID=1821566 RepID=A0A142K952_9CAUD|nr:hypothetical protein BJD55_gp131 [Gordonia phage Yvonnetastic]AMS02635.1 hypothetical protein SEA_YVONNETASTIC_91 [Gordonia phage Yvonnetastic]WKW86067.1 hypothetical protein SEA_JONJAMES_93 [Gordonia Phage JonJames]